MPSSRRLTLDLPDAAHALFMRLPLLRHAAARRRETLLDIYYDTHRHDLRQRALMLRLRKRGSGWVQTVRHHAAPTDDAPGPDEWETPYANGFDFTAIDDPAVRRSLEKPRIRRGLAAFCEINVRRIVWQLQPTPTCTVEVACDRGWIAANGRRAPVSEVAITLIRGTPGQFRQIVFALAERVPLTPALTSRLERGYLLAGNAAMVPARAHAVDIGPHEHPLAAFRAIAINCLAHLQQNHAGALTDTDPEYVHQMRVATRRLRAAMRMFSPVLPSDFSDRLVPALRELMATLGRTRDLDVLLAEIVGPVSAALVDDPRISAMGGMLTDRLYATRAETVTWLGRPGYGRLLLLATFLLQEKAFASPSAAGETGSTPTLRDFARRRLRKLQRRTQELAGHARSDDPASLHTLRIAIKRLRYGLEFFGALMPAKSYTIAAKQLAALQDKLGQLNDLANAGTVLMACAGNDPNLREAVALIGGWHGPRHAALLASLPRQLDIVRKLRLPRLQRA